MTTEEKAKVYANEIEGRFSDDFLDTTHLYHECRKAYLAGAAEALRSQWRDAKMEEPEPNRDKTLMVALKNKDGSLIFEHGSYIGHGIYRSPHDNIPGLPVTAWMNIPPLPDTEEQ